MYYFVYQRDKKDANGKDIYLYYHTRVSKNGWYLSYGTDFQEKSNKSFASLYSSGKLSKLALFVVYLYTLRRRNRR